MVFTPLKPNVWPQDTLEIPAGMGGMPPMERGNALRARAEYATYSQLYLLAANTAALQTQTFTILTDQDGDFWCDQISIAPFAYINAFQGFPLTPSVLMGVKDIRTGRDLFYSTPIGVSNLAAPPARPDIPANTLPITLFRKTPTVPTNFSPFFYNGQFPIPQQFRDTGTLIQPICFTRQGGIQVSFTNQYAIPANYRYEVSVVFSGWKEYTNASA